MLKPRGDVSAIGPEGETNEDVCFGCSGNPLGRGASFIIQDCFILPPLWFLHLSEGGEKGFSMQRWGLEAAEVGC